MNKSIESLIETFNTGWTQGEFEAVESILHEDVVFIAPDLVTEIIGKQACLQTIKEYTSNADTLLFEIKNQKINTWLQTAIISIDYLIEYLMKGKKYREMGKEFWTLSREKDGWKMVWRVMVANKNLK
ncbi:MAG: nuclear transport factor 2 family protein [Bacteroidota bacterium]